ncbi:hypothetical protein BDQ17DRAFT_1323742 [Cyathus striatus]|nr:hypothetical protein BDQ17DRAFT_1323742 [Cyathus striatus]
MPRKKHNGKREAALRHETTKHREIISNTKEHVNLDVTHDPMYDPVSSAIFIEEEPEIDLDVQITPIAKPSKFKLERAQLTCEEEEELTDDALDTNITGISEKDCLISLERLESSQSSVDSSTDVESTNKPLPSTSLQGDHDALESGKDTTNSNVSDVDEGILTSVTKELSSDKFVLERKDLQNRIKSAPKQARNTLKKRISSIRPAAKASEAIAARFNRTWYFLPENKQGKGAYHKSYLDQLDVNSAIQNWLKGEVPLDKGGFKGRLCAPKLQHYVNEFLFPSLQIEDKICLTTSVSWLK